MKCLANILLVLVAIMVIILALPVIGLGIGALIAFSIFFIWLLPILLIMASDVTGTGEKIAWILAIIFLSWFAWIFYFLLAPIKPRQRLRY